MKGSAAAAEDNVLAVGVRKATAGEKVKEIDEKSEMV